MPKKIDLCGPPQILPSENLPSSSDVIRYKKYLDTVHDHNLIDIVHEVSEEVLKRWREANPKFEFPIILKDSIVKLKISKLLDDHNHYARGNGKKKYRDRFINDLDKLFNILRCNCSIMVCSKFGCPAECQNGVHISCSCPSSKKIPVSELQFIRSQKLRKFHDPDHIDLLNKVHWSEAPLVETEPEILVSLKMEQYPKYVNFDSYVEQLRKGPESLFDVSIRCSSGKIFKAHKFILCKYSGFFNALFSDNHQIFSEMPLEDQLHPFIILDIQETLLQLLLNFMYSGRICESMTEAMKEELLSVSKFLVIKSLHHFLCKSTEKLVKQQKRNERRLAVEAEEERECAQFTEWFFNDDDSINFGEKDKYIYNSDNKKENGVEENAEENVVGENDIIDKINEDVVERVNTDSTGMKSISLEPDTVSNTSVTPKPTPKVINRLPSAASKGSTIIISSSIIKSSVPICPPRAGTTIIKVSAQTSSPLTRLPAPRAGLTIVKATAPKNSSSMKPSAKISPIIVPGSPWKSIFNSPLRTMGERDPVEDIKPESLDADLLFNDYNIQDKIESMNVNMEEEVKMETMDIKMECLEPETFSNTEQIDSKNDGHIVVFNVENPEQNILIKQELEEDPLSKT